MTDPTTQMHVRVLRAVGQTEAALVLEALAETPAPPHPRRRRPLPPGTI